MLLLKMLVTIIIQQCLFYYWMYWDINAKLFYEYVLPFYFAVCLSVRPLPALTASSSFQNYFKFAKYAYSLYFKPFF